EPAAELPEPRLPRRETGARGERPVRAVGGRVQRDELEHGAGHPRHAERVEREPDPGDPRAARPPFRRPRDLVTVRSGRGAGLSREGLAFFWPRITRITRNTEDTEWREAVPFLALGAFSASLRLASLARRSAGSLRSARARVSF